MSALFILQGPPCSGKTTWARKKAASERETVIVNLNEIRHSLGDYWMPSREQYVQAVEFYAIREGLHMGYNVISDATNLSADRIDKLKALAAPEDAPVFTQEFYVPFPEAVRRDFDIRRPYHIGEAAIYRFYEKYFPDRLKEETAADPGPYAPAPPEASEGRILIDADGNSRWIPTKDDIEKLKTMAMLRYPLSSIALALEIPVSELRRYMAVPTSEVYKAYHLAKVTAELEYRDKIRRMAMSGDLNAVSIIEGWDAEQKKEENGLSPIL